MNVAVVGASGETGQSIVDALLRSTKAFRITILARPTSAEKPEIQRYESQGVKVIPVELEGPYEKLVQALQGQETVISCVIPFTADAQISLANAAKDAGVRRFVPSSFGPICPPSGVLVLREIKEKVLHHIQKIYLPYTVIDVGWWFQNSAPRLPSGKIDYAVKFPMNSISGDGNLRSALTDIRDVGKYVEHIITDPRTLNKSVFVYNELLTQKQIFSMLEEASGETISRDYITDKEVNDTIDAAMARYEQDPSPVNLLGLSSTQYAWSIWFRGDNLPQRALYLGYLNGKELYPDLEFVSFSDYVNELVAGTGKGVYSNRVFGFEKDTNVETEK